MYKPIIIYFVMIWTIVASYRMNNKLKIGIGDPKSSDLFNELPEDKYFSQKLDHFDSTDETTWRQVIEAFIFFSLPLLPFKMVT